MDTNNEITLLPKQHIQSLEVEMREQEIFDMPLSDDAFLSQVCEEAEFENQVWNKDDDLLSQACDEIEL